YQSHSKVYRMHDNVITIYRVLPPIMHSTITGVMVESHSFVSFCDVWKYHAILPFSTVTATTEQVYRFVCASRGARSRAVYAGVGLPVPKMYRCVSGSYDPGIQTCAPPCCAASKLAHVSSPGSPCFIGTV